MQSQTISELYTDGRNIFATLMTFSNLQNISIINFLWKIQRDNFQTATTELLNKILNRKKISDKQFHVFVTLKYLEVTKSINSQTNNKSPGNDGFTAEFYKHFSNELQSF